jgi:hypothetical protein
MHHRIQPKALSVYNGNYTCNIDFGTITTYPNSSAKLLYKFCPSSAEQKVESINLHYGIHDFNVDLITTYVRYVKFPDSDGKIEKIDLPVIKSNFVTEKNNYTVGVIKLDNSLQLDSEVSSGLEIEINIVAGLNMCKMNIFSIDVITNC